MVAASPTQTKAMRYRSGSYRLTHLVIGPQRVRVILYVFKIRTVLQIENGKSKGDLQVLHQGSL